jgi:hypothetical protein
MILEAIKICFIKLKENELPNSEIEEVKLFYSLPENLTYPSIHNVLLIFFVKGGRVAS